MNRSLSQWRLIVPIGLSSLLLVVLCTSVAAYLYNLQANTADVLGENIGSRRAAADLEEALADLVALHRNRVEAVSPLHDRIERHLEAIRAYADKPEEQRLAGHLAASFDRYRRGWETAQAGGAADRDRLGAAAVAVLTQETLPACQELRRFNSAQIEQSEQAHRETLRAMAWGLAVVGVVGALAGLLVGYGVARGVGRSLHLLQIHIQDAAHKLSRDLPTVELTDDSPAALHEKMHGVLGQIEAVVLQLQERESEVLRAEQLAAVGQLAAGVAHEIRNPLTSIKMLVQAGREGGDGRGLADEDLQIIEAEIRRLERTLNTFLDFARPPQLRRARVDFVTVVEQTLGLTRGRAAQQKVKVRFRRPPEALFVNADAEQMQQVLVNVVLNALDAMPQGGALDLEVGRDGGSGVRARVRDSGAGVRGEVLARLFEPFVSSKDTGVGLGLVVSRRIVEEHGGAIRLYNHPEGGACCEVQLPAA